MIELNREYLVKKYEKDNLFNLTKIKLSSNRIRKIDSNTFKNLNKLETLDLKYNQIEEIDVRLFESFSNLKELKLNKNKLKRIDSNTFKNLSKLETLWFNNNAIEEIDLRLFESLSNLKVLNLSNNKLNRIYFNTFKNLTKLETLWLNNNAIEEIDFRLFESLSNLKHLYLDKNKLKRIDRKCFEPLKSTEKILLYENVGLNVLSFRKPSADIWDHEKEKLKKYGSISEWNEFLQQFPQLEKQRERKEREAVKIAEENKIEEKQVEQENTNKPSSSSSSSNQSKNNDLFKGLLLNDRYQVVKKIGKGHFGSVYLVDDTKIDIKKVREKAMKIMDKLDSATENEIALFSVINHENIVKYLDHFHMSIEGENQTFLIVEYCENGDLRNKIEEAKRSDRNFEDRQLLDWMSQSTNALKYLHSKKTRSDYTSRYKTRVKIHSAKVSYDTK